MLICGDRYLTRKSLWLIGSIDFCFYKQFLSWSEKVFVGRELQTAVTLQPLVGLQITVLVKAAKGESENNMRSVLRGSVLLLAISVFMLAAPESHAQDAAAPPDASSSDLAQRVKELEEQVRDLRSELASVKSTTDSTSTAPVAASPAAAAVASAPPASSTSIASLLGPTSLSGFVDGYYGLNLNHPSSGTTPYRAFDTRSDQFGLNLVELVLDKAPDAAASRTGYHVAVGFGDAINSVNSTDAGGLGFDQYLKEAYFSYLAPAGKGLQIDFGKFVTPHGAEVIETKDNWNYSRGILFTWAIPFYHFGLRAKYAFNDKASLTGFLVNGWNNVVDNNSGKTYGVSLGLNPSPKFGIIENYMAGEEQPVNNGPVRQLSDTVVTITPTGKLAFMANLDYGRDRVIGGPSVFWTGIAGYVKYSPSEKYAFVGRYEYFDDHDGFMTGTAQNMSEFTGTFQRTIAHNIITRFEYRHDYSNQPVFFKGSNPDTNQDTLTAGLIFTFDSREAK